MKQSILLLSLVLVICSCTKKELIILVADPSDFKLDKLKLEINIDNKRTETINLEATTITPSFTTHVFEISEEKKHLLKIKLKDTMFNYQIYYPQEKYIIISPYLEKNGKLNIGILKQGEKFILH